MPPLCLKVLLGEHTDERIDTRSASNFHGSTWHFLVRVSSESSETSLRATNNSSLRPKVFETSLRKIIDTLEKVPTSDLQPQ